MLHLPLRIQLGGAKARFRQTWGGERESSVSKESPYSLERTSFLIGGGEKDSTFLVREKTTYRVVPTVLG